MSRAVVVVEDDFLIAEYLSQLCEEFGYEVLGVAATAPDAVDLIVRTRPSHVLMDMRLNGPGDGVDVARAVRAQGCEPTITFVTGSNEPETHARIRACGPHRVLIKPIEAARLAEALRD